MKKTSAFTLAEVLIVLGIIGVIAAMTLPTLISNYQKQVLVNQLRKAHSTVAQAIEQAMYEEKAVNFVDTGMYNRCLNSNNRDSWNCQQEVKKYLKTSDYTWSSSSYFGLTSSGSYFTKGNQSYSDYTNGPRITLPSGAYVYFSNNNRITLDVNGAQKPNLFSRDLFSFNINPETGELTPTGPWPNAQRIIDDGWEMNY